MSFKDLGIVDDLIDFLKNKGITKPFDVQLHCIPKIMEGKDVVAIAKTGSGKTATFLIPILQSLMENPRPMHALIVTPTRELAEQIGEQARGLCLAAAAAATGSGESGSHQQVQVVTGGRDMIRESQSLASGPQIVVATPGRLAALLRVQEQQELGTTEWTLLRTRVLVLDEFDRLLEDNFGDDLAAIVRALPKRRQTLLFSATFTPAVKQAVEQADREAEASGTPRVFLWKSEDIPADAAGVTVSSLEQYWLNVRASRKDAYLIHLVQRFLVENPHSLIMIFTNNCKSCHIVGLMLTTFNLANVVLHSAMRQRERVQSLAEFKSSQKRILIGTDLASRGLDIPTVDLVVNHSVPVKSMNYVHRVGRTARAGKAGSAVTLVDEFEGELLESVERFISQKLKRCEIVQDKEVAKIIFDVRVARSAAEEKLDQMNFDERREINKAKRKMIELDAKWEAGKEAGTGKLASVTASEQNQKSPRKRKVKKRSEPSESV